MEASKMGGIIFILLPAFIPGALTPSAKAIKLQAVFVNSETGLFRKPFLQFQKTAVVKINHTVTSQAYQMMVMLSGAAGVMPAVMRRLYFTDKPRPGKRVQAAVNCYQSDTRILRTQPVVKLLRGEMAFSLVYGSQYG
jgi:hypothetical protein